MSNYYCLVGVFIFFCSVAKAQQCVPIKPTKKIDIIVYNKLINLDVWVDSADLNYQFASNYVGVDQQSLMLIKKKLIDNLSDSFHYRKIVGFVIYIDTFLNISNQKISDVNILGYSIYTVTKKMTHSYYHKVNNKYVHIPIHSQKTLGVSANIAHELYRLYFERKNKVTAIVITDNKELYK